MAKRYQCIEGEEVKNLLTGQTYKYTSDLEDELHFPIRLIKL